FARHERVVGEVPPEVVLVTLFPALALPGPERLEGLAVQPEDAACLVGAVRAAEPAHVDRVGSAMRGVRSRVAGLARLLGRLHRQSRRGIEAWVRRPAAHAATSRLETSIEK